MVWRYNTSTTGDHDVGAGACITAPGVNGFADGEVYIDGKDQVLYALDLTTGAVGWSFDLKAAIGVKVSNSVSTPACVGSVVYVGYGYGVWAFDAATGAEQWYSGTSSPVSGVVLSSPAVAGGSGDQVIYSDDGGGAATAYRVSDGTTLWHYLTSMPMYGSDAVSDGQVFFSGLDGNVYAFGPAIGAISGIVTDASTQAALAGATVSCTCSVGDATTDAGGSYSFPNLTPASDYSLTFSTSGYATQTFDNVAVTAGATTTEDAQLAPGVGGMIAGTATDATASGNPVLEGVTVTCTCEGGSQTTDASGQYAFDGVPSGTYSMSFSATGYVTQVIAPAAVSPPATTTENAALTEDGGISGTVTDAQTHAPISGATVTCTGQSGSTSTNSSGTYSFPDVPPDTYTVSVSDAGYSSASNSGVVVSAGTTTTEDFALTASAHQVVFSDGFESGNLSAWTASKGLTIENGVVHSGSHAAEVKTSHGGGFARKTLPSTYATGYGRVWVDIVSQSSQVDVLSLEAASGSAIASLYVTPSGQLGMGAGGTRTVSSTKVSHGTFHELELSVTVNGTSSTTQVWLDGTLVPALSRTTNLGTSPIAQLQIGQAGGSGTYKVVFDDVAFDTAPLP